MPLPAPNRVPAASMEGQNAPVNLAKCGIPSTGVTGLKHWLLSDGWGARIRTWECRYQKPVPYRLATPHDRSHGHVAEELGGFNPKARAWRNRAPSAAEPVFVQQFLPGENPLDRRIADEGRHQLVATIGQGFIEGNVARAQFLEMG